jgi:hypothetical protein
MRFDLHTAVLQHMFAQQILPKSLLVLLIQLITKYILKKFHYFFVQSSNQL